MHRFFDKTISFTVVLSAGFILELQIRFGTDYVRKWNFETWNEPDHKDFCGINFNLESFLAYYDVSLAAVKTALKDAKVKQKYILKYLIKIF